MSAHFLGSERGVRRAVFVAAIALLAVQISTPVAGARTLSATYTPGGLQEGRGPGDGGRDRQLGRRLVLGVRPGSAYNGESDMLKQTRLGTVDLLVVSASVATPLVPDDPMTRRTGF